MKPKKIMDKRHLICQSFVGVLKQQLMVIQSMDNKFCRDLFGQPYDTYNGTTPDGYVIAINNKPFPMVVISPNKIIVKARNKETLIKYVCALKEELSKMHVPISFSAFGINSEYQWTGLDSNVESWLWNHYINKSIDSRKEIQLCTQLNFRIGLNDNQFVNVELAPRMGIRNGLYANINHHHNMVLEEIPDSAKLAEYIDKSDEIIISDVIANIIEN